MSSVLYDVPGPRGRRRNNLLGLLFGLIVDGALTWFLIGLAHKGELDGNKWSPFLRGTTWTQFILPGLGNTLRAAALAMVIALVVGLLFGVARMSDHAWLRWPAAVVVEFFRAVPVLLMMVFGWMLFYQYTAVPIDTIPLLAVVTGLVLYNGSVLAEVFRAGIQALPRGQREAAAALGLRKGQIMANVLLPQAITSMLPVIVSQLVVVLKDTALGGLLIVGYVELLRSADGIKANYSNVVASYIVIAAIYILLNFAVSQLAAAAERRLHRHGRGGRVAPAAPLPGGDPSEAGAVAVPAGRPR